MFPVQAVPRCYKQDNWRNELVVEQSPVGKNESTIAEDVVGIRHRQRLVKAQQTEDFVRTIMNCRECELAVAL
jgi:hypothetical protein